MNLLARILIVITLLAVCALPAAADAIPITIPTVTAGATSNGITARLYPITQENMALSWTTSSTNVTVRISVAVDEARFHTNYYVLAFGSGTTVTNLPIGGVSILNIDSVLSTGTINATNTVSWERKPNK